jgi:uncharacterized membrane protein
MTRPPRSRIPALVALVSGWIVLALIVGHAPVPARTACTFLFAAFCPGLALRSLTPARDFLERLVFTIAVSLSIGALVTMSLALSHHFTTELTVAVLAAVTSCLALVDLVLVGRASRAALEVPHSPGSAVPEIAARRR